MLVGLLYKSLYTHFLSGWYHHGTLDHLALNPGADAVRALYSILILK